MGHVRDMLQEGNVFTHFALLVGIDDYPERPLRGCVRDVREIKRCMDGIPEPSLVHTKLLTTSPILDGDASCLDGQSCVMPTFRNFVDSMKWIISQAGEGAFVYIHFSGHGTAFRPPLQSSPSYRFSNKSTGDLALNLIQENKSGIQYLRGSELAYLLKEMVENKLLVTLVLDCCFSGSVMRNDSSVRNLDYDPCVDEAYPPSFGQCLGPEQEVRFTPYRGATLRPNWLVNPDGYTVLTACGPTERAREIEVDGEIHGALSYFLGRTIANLGGVGGRQGYIYYHLRSMFEKTKRQRQHEQNPMMYGNKDLGFFGPASLSIGPVPIPIICGPGRRFKLQAGKAHGVREGDRFSVHTSLSFKSNDHEVETDGETTTATVTGAGALTSDLEIRDTIPTFRSTILVAMSLTCLSLRDFPIRIDQSVPDTPEWKVALQEGDYLSMFRASEANTGNRHSFSVSMVERNSYSIRDELSRQLLIIPVISDEPRDSVKRVVHALEHMAKYELVQSLKNDSPTKTVRDFEESFKARLLNSKGDAFEPGCKHAGRFNPKCSHRECVVEVEQGAQLWLEISNLTKDGGPAIIIHVFNMSPAWEIENILRGDYEVIPSAGANQSEEFQRGTTGVWKKRLLMQGSQGHQGDDVIKIFLTANPASFLSLELPELGHLNQRKVSSKTRGEEVGELSEVWAALSFRIHISVE